MTADAAYVAEVAEAMARRYYGSTAFDQFSDGGKAEALSSCWADATVAVETLTPLIRAQVAETCAPIIRAFIVEQVGWDAGVLMDLQAADLAARIVKATP